MLPLYSYQASLLGTNIELQLFAPNELLARKIFALIKGMEAQLTVNRDDSQIMQANRSAGIAPVQLTDDVFFLVEKAHQASLLTDSSFNVAIGPLVKCWKIGFTGTCPPSVAQINSLLTLINPHDVILNKQHKTLFLKKRGMAIDLGAIAKGYIADVVKQFLIRQGESDAMLNLGGNIHAIGGNSNYPIKQWQIGLQTPFSPHGEFIGTINLYDKAVVTSGIYERYFTYLNKQYHHILDAKTGYPIDNELSSVTVICDYGIDADIYTTLLFGLGVNESLIFLANKPEIEAIFITKSNEVILSSNRQFTFKLHSQQYRLVYTK